MATKYLLPCACGTKIPVEARQAGEQIPCSCGSRLEVPTLRGLADLELVEVAGAAPAWSRRRGIFFVVGIAWLVLGLLATGYFWSLAAAPVEFSQFDETADQLAADVDRLPPSETLLLWRMFRDRPELTVSGPAREAAQRGDRRRKRWFAYAAAVATLAGTAWLVLSLKRQSSTPQAA